MPRRKEPYNLILADLKALFPKAHRVDLVATANLSVLLLANLRFLGDYSESDLIKFMCNVNRTIPRR